ncbi:hypothetical protein AAV94_06625 [Lampropedia cohaerens]|uniref:Transposase IS200-like domain-containing protein n=1 Tax=Lampropedia cohaerens TaxID=1610491 RepID=A0A0U1Q061_9BURK|nr:transposase [Lampropedia cohaerens]KKW68140.1 hypothetical protein AAV94_06625 [Lampropedia cohaerens]
MARLPRLVIPGLPHHVILRGINAAPVFVDDADFTFWCDMLADQLKAQPIHLHAYALLPSRIHLLVTPADAGILSRFMQALGRRYVRYFNQRHGRFGTLWEGRYRAGPMQPTPHVLNVMTYLDWLPVTQGLAERPRDYVWSSHRHYAGLAAQKMLTPHPLYWELADTPFGREAAYQAFSEAGLGHAVTEQIEKSAMGGWLLASASFAQDIAPGIARRLAPGRPGRPRKHPATGDGAASQGH